MFINLGDLELDEGRLKEAKAHFETALRKEPEQPLAILSLAAVALKQNDFKAAHEQLQRALKMPLVEPQAHEFLTVLENKEDGRVDLLRLRLAARTGPPNWSIERRYVKVLDESGATPQAIAELQACLRREWYRAESWKLLSRLLAKSGRRQEALAALTQAHAYDVHLDMHGDAP
jgi:predicted Zn-dependent protease